MKPKPVLVISLSKGIDSDKLNRMNAVLSAKLKDAGWLGLVVDSMDRDEVLAFMPDKDSSIMSLDDFIEYISPNEDTPPG